MIDREAINQYSYVGRLKLGSITSVHGSGCTEFVHKITIQIVTILYKTNSDSLYYTSASAQFVLRKYLGLPLLSNSKFSKVQISILFLMFFAQLKLGKDKTCLCRTSARRIENQQFKL